MLKKFAKRILPLVLAAAVVLGGIVVADAMGGPEVIYNHKLFIFYKVVYRDKLHFCNELTLILMCRHK